MKSTLVRTIVIAVAISVAATFAAFGGTNNSTDESFAPDLPVIETEAPTEPETEAPTEPETEAPTEPKTEAPEETQPSRENDDDDDDDDDGPHRTWRPEDLHTGPGVETQPEVVVIEEQPNYDVPETIPETTPIIVPEEPNRDLPKTADTTHNVPVCAVAVLVIVGGGAILIANRRKNG